MSVCDRKSPEYLWEGIQGNTEKYGISNNTLQLHFLMSIHTNTVDCLDTFTGPVVRVVYCIYTSLVNIRENNRLLFLQKFNQKLYTVKQ